MLAQEQPDGTVHPIAYASRTLQKHEHNYGITELEGLGVVWAVKHFRPYLFGHQCTVYTDHEALKSLLNTPQPSGKLARWGMALQELDLKIVHRSGKHNANADALSRSPLPSSDDEHPAADVVAAITEDTFETGESKDDGDLAVLQSKDSELAPIINFIETGALPTEERLARKLTLSQSQYTVLDGILYKVEPDATLRIIPPRSLRNSLIDTAHGGRFGAHLGDTKVHSELKKHYWWGGMRKDIAQKIKACVTCASHSPGLKVKPPLTPIPVAGAFDRIGVDVLQLPKTRRGNRYAVVFMDYMTKWPEVFPVADQSSATIARLLVEEIISRHGVPAQILSDRRKAFLSGLMKELEILMGYKKVNTTAYHPQTDGLVEKYNRTLTAMLAKTTNKEVEWDQQLPYVLFAYRASQQMSTRESPFYLLYGRDPRLPVPEVLSPEPTRITTDLHDYGVELHAKMSTAWKLAQECIGRAKRRQKEQYDKRSTIVPFRAGERVFLYKPEKTGAARKLSRPFHGPYRVLGLDANTATLVRVDRPEEEPLRVAIDRLRRCPEEIANDFWPPGARRRKGVGHRSGVQRVAPDADARTRTEVSDCADGGGVDHKVVQQSPMSLLEEPMDGDAGPGEQASISSPGNKCLTGLEENSRGCVGENQTHILGANQEPNISQQCHPLPLLQIRGTPSRHPYLLDRGRSRKIRRELRKGSGQDVYARGSLRGR